MTLGPALNPDLPGGLLGQHAGQIEAATALLTDLFSQAPGMRGYAEDLSVILRSGRGRESNTTPFVLLPFLCCEVVGGDSGRTTPVMAAWYALMLAARILDDLEDGDTGGPLWVQLGAPRAVNVATGLILAAPLALLQLQQYGVTDNHLIELLKDTQRAALLVSAGQRDVLIQSELLENVWETAETKGGIPFALACRAGALVGGGSAGQIERLGQFGHHLGVLTQIADDVADIWQTPDGGDLAAGRKTLPVAYALAVASPAARRQLQHLLDQSRQDALAARKARQMLVDLGVLHALVLESESRRQQARSALQAGGHGSPAGAQLLELVERASGWMKPREDNARCSGR